MLQQELQQVVLSRGERQDALIDECFTTSQVQERSPSRRSSDRDALALVVRRNNERIRSSSWRGLNGLQT